MYTNPIGRSEEALSGTDYVLCVAITRLLHYSRVVSAWVIECLSNYLSSIQCGCCCCWSLLYLSLTSG